MGSTVRRVLLQTLEELSRRDLERFRDGLLHRDGEPRVRRRAVEEKDELVIVDVLVSTFTEPRAGGVAVEILRAIDCNDLAGKLETRLQTLPKLPKGPSDASVSTPTARPEEHFVDRHRSALIQRLRSVAPIMDLLLDHKVASQEDYDCILAIANPQDRIRKLYDGPLTSGGTKGKDIFLKILYEKEPFMMADLSGQ